MNIEENHNSLVYKSTHELQLEQYSKGPNLDHIKLAPIMDSDKYRLPIPDEHTANPPWLLLDRQPIVEPIKHISCSETEMLLINMADRLAKLEQEFIYLYREK